MLLRIGALATAPLLEPDGSGSTGVLQQFVWRPRFTGSRFGVGRFAANFPSVLALIAPV